MSTSPEAGKHVFESDSFRSSGKKSVLEGQTEGDSGFDNEFPVLLIAYRNSEPQDPPA